MLPENRVINLSHLDFAPGCGVRIREAGRLTSFDGCHYHQGNYACWHVIAGGSGTVRNGHGTFSPRRGDMFSLVPDGVVEYFDDPADPWRFYWIHIDGPGAPDFCRAAGFLPPTPWKRTENGEEILRLFQAVWQEMYKEENWVPARLASRLFHLLEAVQGHCPPASRTPEELAEQAVELLDNPAHAAMNVNELGDALRVSRTTLFHAFRKRFGCSPTAKITEIRMNRARTLLLENPGLTIEAVARMAAFENAKYFIRAFRKNCGTTPGRFRKIHTPDVIKIHAPDR